MDSYTIDVDSNLYTAMADIAAEYDCFVSTQFGPDSNFS